MKDVTWNMQGNESIARDIIDELQCQLVEQADEIESLQQQLIASDPTEAQGLIRQLRQKIEMLGYENDALRSQQDVLKSECNEAIRRANSLERQLKTIKRKKDES